MKYLKKYEDMSEKKLFGPEVKKFFGALKNEIKETYEMRKIFGKYINGGKITKKENEFIREQSKDILRMIGIGSLNLIPIPGTTLIIPLLIKHAHRFGIDLIPTSFKNKVDESITEEQMLQYIDDGKKIYTKYVQNYPEHNPKDAMTPIDIDNKGNIALDINSEIYYTKLDWIEGIEEKMVSEENLIYYELDPDNNQPDRDPNTGEDLDHWKNDNNYMNLLKNHGGRKGVVKKMKRDYDMDYSDCDNEGDLYGQLRSDGMLTDESE